MAEIKTTREIIEGIRNEPIPDGWDPASGGAYTRELWAASAEDANEINQLLGREPCYACGWSQRRHPATDEEPPIVHGALDAQAEAEIKVGRLGRLLVQACEMLEDPTRSRSHPELAEWRKANPT